MSEKIRVSELYNLLIKEGFNITKASIRNWCENGLGTKMGKLWYIEKDRIQDIISGKFFADKYKRGKKN